MRRVLFSVVSASVLLAGVGLASAQSSSTTTTTTWTNDQGSAMRSYSTSQHYNSLSDPSMKMGVGMPLPDSVTLYPLPQTAQVPDSDMYSYTIINNQPVVVERTTRKVVHTWQ
jgi:hypothetical protein